MNYLSKLIALILLFVAPASAQDWVVYPGRATNEVTGKTYNVGSKRNALAFAIERSSASGSVIECNGKLEGVRIAIGENYRRKEVVRKDPLRITLVAGPDHVSIGSIAWGGKKHPGGAHGLAVEYLELNGVTVDGRFSQSPLAGYMDTQYGDIVFDGVTLLSTKSKTKWGNRSMGRPRSYTVRNCVFLGGGQEHAWYIDDPETFLIFEDNIAMNWRRTMLQVVTRKKPGSAGIFPPAATGNLFIERNEARDCGRDGAHNFTVAGWPNGFVRFKGNRGQSKWGCGLFITYRDFKQGDLLTEDGYQVGRLLLMDNQGIYPNADRDMVGIGGVGKVKIRGGNLRWGFKSGSKAAYDIEWLGQKNGDVVFDGRENPSDWNFHMGDGPIRKNRVTMSKAQVTKLWSGNPGAGDGDSSN